MTLQIIVFGLVIALVWYFMVTRVRLDKDRDQHHLASLLIAVAAGGGQATRGDLDAWLAGRNYRTAERTSRLNHAVKLAGTAVSGELLARVTALARELAQD